MTGRMVKFLGKGRELESRQVRDSRMSGSPETREYKVC